MTERWTRLRALTESLPDRRANAGVRADVVLELIADVDAAAQALVALRLIAGTAGRINDADAHLTSLGFAFPFTGYRNPRLPEGS